jgi:hypothetical protein
METIYDDIKTMAVRITSCTYPSGPFYSIDSVMAGLHPFANCQRSPFNKQQWQKDWQQGRGRQVVPLAEATREVLDPVSRQTQHESISASGQRSVRYGDRKMYRVSKSAVHHETYAHHCELLISSPDENETSHLLHRLTRPLSKSSLSGGPAWTTTKGEDLRRSRST